VSEEQPEQATPEQPQPESSPTEEPTRDSEPRTGVAAADEAAARLADIDDAGLDEHVEIYEDVHRRLQEGLADLDEQ
jgi:hypothetical protein